MVNINDSNFKEEIGKLEKLVVVDFYAEWCPPCNQLAPILEKVTNELENEVVLIKANVDQFPQTAGDFNVTKIPFVVLFKKGEVVDSFLGFKEEEDIRQWISKHKEDDSKVDSDLLMEYEDYAANNDFILNPNKKLVEGILRGLMRNEEDHGARYCPCRRITGSRRDDKNIICPCAYHKEEIEIDGKCMCGLFLKSDQ